MPTIIDSALSAATITYNGVQFGGSEATYSSSPPVYSFHPSPVYDRSGRAVTAVRYQLTLRCFFYGVSESDMTLTMTAIKRRLMEPGKLLKIIGLGTGFGTVTTDVTYGPKPIDAECTPIGFLCFEVVWAVEFTAVECAGNSPIFTSDGSQSTLPFMAFNFSNTWHNDFEGITTRTIQGYCSIVAHLDPNQSKKVLHVAEETRGQIIVVIPAGYRRVVNDWHEDYSKQELNFNIVDEQLPGDVFPPGCSLADGEMSFNSGGPGFMEADITLSMTLKTAPHVARNVAGQVFITAAISKQSQMAKSLGPPGSKGTSRTLIPTRLTIRNRKYDGARITDASMGWHMTGALGPMLAATKLWDPLTPSDENAYNLWKTSVQDVWNNRGTSQIRGNIEEAVILDLCDNVTSKTIGQTPSLALEVLAASLPGFSCPFVPEDGGWIAHDLEVKLLQAGSQSWHKPAVPFVPKSGTVNGGLGFPVPTSSAQNRDQEDVVEHHGYPSTFIGLRFKGLRYKHKPQVPQIKSVGGREVIDTGQGSISEPKLAWDAFCCPVWYVEGTRIYRIAGMLPAGHEPKPVGNPNSCENFEVPTEF